MGASSPAQPTRGANHAGAGPWVASAPDVFAYFRAPTSWIELARRTIVDTFEDGVPGLAAQLAFYFFLAVFPALLFLVSLIAYLPVEPALTAALERLRAVLPHEVLTILQQQIVQVLAGAHGGLVTMAIAGAIWSSSAAMTAIIYALNRAYDIEEWRPWWQTRLIAIGLTIALSMFVLCAIVLVVGGSDLAAWASARIGAGPAFERAWAVGQWPLAFALVVLGVDLVYYFAPNADTEWVWVTPGALLATALWLATSVGFRFYVRNFSDYTAVYGAIGGVIVLMLWFYLSGFALLIGAELNAEIDRALPTRDDAPQGPERRKKIGPAAERAAS
jgi:membrane protein